jgi:hypothetical protein
MFTDQGGLLWLVIDVFLVVALGGALAYGLWMWRRKRADRATERAARQATQRMYHHEEAEAEARVEGRPTVDTTAPPS